MVIQLIDRNMTSGQASNANIDMYPLELHGFELPIYSQFKKESEQKDDKGHKEAVKESASAQWHGQNMKKIST